jgi:thiamine pyrophosphokinase
VRALVITGGAAPSVDAAQPWLHDRQLVVAADSGLETARAYGVRPSIVVGDFDSLSDRSLLDEYSPDAVRRFGAAKDDTDTELALSIAFDEGGEDVALLGGGGGRLDHLLAIAWIFARERYPSVWVTAESEVRPVVDELVLTGRPGERVSFFPIGGDRCRMESRGLRWALDDLRWGPGDVGVSNEFVAGEVRVRMIEGRLLMVRPLRSQ